MSVLDLRNTGYLYIRILANTAWNFELTAEPGAPTFIGAAATMVITGSTTTTIGIGTGLTITAFNKLLITPPQLAQGNYSYILTITPLNGDIIRISDKIVATNE